MGSLLYEVAVSGRVHDGREIHEVRVQIPSSGLYGCSSENQSDNILMGISVLVPGLFLLQGNMREL